MLQETLSILSYEKNQFKNILLVFWSRLYQKTGNFFINAEKKLLAGNVFFWDYEKKIKPKYFVSVFTVACSKNRKNFYHHEKMIPEKIA